MSWDERSQKVLATVYPDVVVRITRVEQDMLRIHNLQLRATQGLRDMVLQQQLYAQGRELKDGVWVVANKKLVVTNSPPGYSWHQFAFAVDCCFAGPDPYLDKVSKERREFIWKEYGRIAKAHGLVWGGDWNGNGLTDANDWDRPHVQQVYGLRLQDVRELYKSGGMAAVWAAADKVRGVPQGQDWYGPLAKVTLSEIGQLA